jgi:hypothetical protein
MSEALKRLTRCGRCGDWFYRCPHIGVPVKMADEEAERVRARYAIGRRLNPEHDVTSYRDGKDIGDPNVV